MTVYRWTSNDDEVAHDAVIVGIGSDEVAFSAWGMDFGEVFASIYWPDRITQGDMVKASLEGPYTVPAALERAANLCALWTFERVVIAIQHRSIWRPEWGELHKIEGFDDHEGAG